MILENSKSGQVIVNRLIVADRFLSRLKGLMFTSELKEGEGLLLKPCNSIHMFFMKYSIDVVFLNKNYDVVHIIKGIRPWRVSPIIAAAHMVIELPAGTIDKNCIMMRDRLKVIDGEG